MVLDMYPKGPITAQPCADGQNPFDIACWFDAGQLHDRKELDLRKPLDPGRTRGRGSSLPTTPERAPALNKIPLVRWQKGFTYVSSTHTLLPRGLNLVFDEWGGEKTSGTLLHAKFLVDLPRQGGRGNAARSALRRQRRIQGLLRRVGE
jgi:hypothetical protein